jgi:hypothetical protein
MAMADTKIVKATNWLSFLIWFFIYGIVLPGILAAGTNWLLSQPEIQMESLALPLAIIMYLTGCWIFLPFLRNSVPSNLMPRKDTLTLQQMFTGTTILFFIPPIFIQICLALSFPGGLNDTIINGINVTFTIIYAVLGLRLLYFFPALQFYTRKVRDNMWVLFVSGTIVEAVALGLGFNLIISILIKSGILVGIVGSYRVKPWAPIFGDIPINIPQTPLEFYTQTRGGVIPILIGLILYIGAAALALAGTQISFAELQANPILIVGVFIAAALWICKICIAFGFNQYYEGKYPEKPPEMLFRSNENLTWAIILTFLIAAISNVTQIDWLAGVAIGLLLWLGGEKKLQIVRLKVFVFQFSLIYLAFATVIAFSSLRGIPMHWLLNVIVFIGLCMLLSGILREMHAIPNDAHQMVQFFGSILLFICFAHLIGEGAANAAFLSYLPGWFHYGLWYLIALVVIAYRTYFNDIVDLKREVIWWRRIFLGLYGALILLISYAFGAQFNQFILGFFQAILPGSVFTPGEILTLTFFFSVAIGCAAIDILILMHQKMLQIPPQLPMWCHILVVISIEIFIVLIAAITLALPLSIFAIVFWIGLFGMIQTRLFTKAIPSKVSILDRLDFACYGALVVGVCSMVGWGTTAVLMIPTQITLLIICMILWMGFHFAPMTRTYHNSFWFYMVNVVFEILTITILWISILIGTFYLFLSVFDMIMASVLVISLTLSLNAAVISRKISIDTWENVPLNLQKLNQFLGFTELIVLLTVDCLILSSAFTYGAIFTGIFLAALVTLLGFDWQRTHFENIIPANVSEELIMGDLLLLSLSGCGIIMDILLFFGIAFLFSLALTLIVYIPILCVLLAKFHLLTAGSPVRHILFIVQLVAIVIFVMYYPIEYLIHQFAVPNPDSVNNILIAYGAYSFLNAGISFIPIINAWRLHSSKSYQNHLKLLLINLIAAGLTFGNISIGLILLRDWQGNLGAGIGFGILLTILIRLQLQLMTFLHPIAADTEKRPGIPLGIYSMTFILLFIIFGTFIGITVPIALFIAGLLMYFVLPSIFQHGWGYGLSVAMMFPGEILILQWFGVSLWLAILIGINIALLALNHPIKWFVHQQAASIPPIGSSANPSPEEIPAPARSPNRFVRMSGLYRNFTGVFTYVMVALILGYYIQPIWTPDPLSTSNAWIWALTTQWTIGIVVGFLLIEFVDPAVRCLPATSRNWWSLGLWILSSIGLALCGGLAATSIPLGFIIWALASYITLHYMKRVFEILPTREISYIISGILLTMCFIQAELWLIPVFTGSIWFLAHLLSLGIGLGIAVLCIELKVLPNSGLTVVAMLFGLDMACFVFFWLYTIIPGWWIAYLGLSIVIFFICWLPALIRKRLTALYWCAWAFIPAGLATAAYTIYLPALPGAFFLYLGLFNGSAYWLLKNIVQSTRFYTLSSESPPPTYYFILPTRKESMQLVAFLGMVGNFFLACFGLLLLFYFITWNSSIQYYITLILCIVLVFTLFNLPIMKLIRTEHLFVENPHHARLLAGFQSGLAISNYLCSTILVAMYFNPQWIGWRDTGVAGIWFLKTAAAMLLVYLVLSTVERFITRYLPGLFRERLITIAWGWFSIGLVYFISQRVNLVSIPLLIGAICGYHFIGLLFRPEFPILPHSVPLSRLPQGQILLWIGIQTASFLFFCEIIRPVPLWAIFIGSIVVTVECYFLRILIQRLKFTPTTDQVLQILSYNHLGIVLYAEIWLWLLSFVTPQIWLFFSANTLLNIAIASAQAFAICLIVLIGFIFAYILLKIDNVFQLLDPAVRQPAIRIISIGISIMIGIVVGFLGSFVGRWASLSEYIAIWIGVLVGSCITGLMLAGIIRKRKFQQRVYLVIVVEFEIFFISLGSTGLMIGFIAIFAVIYALLFFLDRVQQILLKIFRWWMHLIDEFVIMLQLLLTHIIRFVKRYWRPLWVLGDIGIGILIISIGSTLSAAMGPLILCAILVVSLGAFPLIPGAIPSHVDSSMGSFQIFKIRLIYFSWLYIFTASLLFSTVFPVLLETVLAFGILFMGIILWATRRAETLYQTNVIWRFICSLITIGLIVGLIASLVNRV